MNAELHALFQADHEERVDQPRHGTPEYNGPMNVDDSPWWLKEALGILDAQQQS